MFLPVRLVTGWAMAWHKGVTWASLADPGHGRTPALELGLFALVTLAAAALGIAYARGRPERPGPWPARSASLCSPPPSP